MDDEEVINLTETADYDYDDWLEFFRKYPAGQLIESQDALKPLLPSDGYAALSRWLDIFENPSKMEKLYKGRLDKQQEESIMDVAIGDDDEKFYIALIQQNTAQLNSSSVSQQEVARLSQNINIFRKELREIRSRKPKSGSVLDKVLLAANKPPNPVAKKKKTTAKAVSTVKKKKVSAASSRSKK